MSSALGEVVGGGCISQPADHDGSVSLERLVRIVAAMCDLLPRKARGDNLSRLGPALWGCCATISP